MSKTTETMTEIVRNRKHRFRKTNRCPGKPAQHRFERRKIRQFIGLSDWDSDSPLNS